MHHAFIDHLAQRQGPVQGLDPRVKIGLALGLIVAIVTVSPDTLARLPGLALLALGAALAARLPFRYTAWRVGLVLPFIAVVAGLVPFTRPGRVLWQGLWGLQITQQGLVFAGLLVAKALLAALVSLVLVATTPFPRLLVGLHRLGLPRVLVLVLSFLYRYLFVLSDEAMRMRRAAAARGFGARSPTRWSTVGGLLGSLFLRTYERAERVYIAMLARGFSGQVPLLDPLRFRALDGLVGGLGLVVIALAWSVA